MQVSCNSGLLSCDSREMMQNTVKLELNQTEIAAIYAYTVFRSSVNLFDASWLDMSIENKIDASSPFKS